MQLSGIYKETHTVFGVEVKAQAPQLVKASGSKYREGQRDGEVQVDRMDLRRVSIGQL